MSARETALNVLIACSREGAWSNSVLKQYILRHKLDRRDSALASRLSYGVLQNRLKLDHYLQQLLKGKLRDLHPAVRDILHLGLYQLYEMDKIPASAAVNESVALAKKYCPRVHSAPGLVNGVLRNAVRTMGQLTPPNSWESIYSHPQPLIDLLLEYVGKSRMETMLKANNAAVNTLAQVNTLKITADSLKARLQQEGVEAAAHSWMPDCLVLSGTGDLEQLPSYREGLFYIQDPAAKLSVLCAELPKADITVLDCCAAPGGKSFAAAISMGDRGRVISCDVHEHKIALIQKGAQRLGIPQIESRVQDGTQFVPQWENAMDAVICDVPCSGYGIIRKKPDIRYKDLKQMEKLPAVQKAILWNQARYVKPGGVLIYSTCTLVRQENEDVVAAFLKEHPNFTTEPLPLPAPLAQNDSGMLALVPGEYDTDGFFICRMRRKETV